MGKNEIPMRRRRLGLRRNLENPRRSRGFNVEIRRNVKRVSNRIGGGQIRRFRNNGNQNIGRRNFQDRRNNNYNNNNNRNFGGVRRNFQQRNNNNQGGRNNFRFNNNRRGGRGFRGGDRNGNRSRGGKNLTREERLNLDLENYWKKDPSYAKNKLDNDLDEYKKKAENEPEPAKN